MVIGNNYRGSKQLYALKIWHTCSNWWGKIDKKFHWLITKRISLLLLEVAIANRKDRQHSSHNDTQLNGLSIMTIITMTLRITTTFSLITLRTMAFSITTINIMVLHYDIRHNICQDNYNTQFSDIQNNNTK